MASLSIESVQKRYAHVTVLKGIDLSIADGEFLILVGPSGCGKSTLLSMIAGLDTVTEGRIRIGERVVNDVSPKDRDIAMVFQSYALYPSMTVRENIEFGLKMKKVPAPERQAAVERVAKTLQIEALLERRPSQLSGGQRQRVAMGRALARNPAIFLFDEPLSNLDAKLRVEMRAEIKSLHQRLKNTIVYVTHDQVEAMTLGDKIAVMKDGVIQQFGSPAEIYERPANQFVASFIGSPTMNFIPATRSVAGGRVQLKVAGQQITLPGTGTDQDGERSVILGVRPEHLSWVSADSPDLTQTLPARVTMLEPTGADTFATVRLGEHTLVVRCSPKASPQVGDEVRLRLDVATLSLFDPVSQSRLTD